MILFIMRFFKKDQTKAKFSNFKGEVDLSEFNNNDTIIVQHPTFENKNILNHQLKNIPLLETETVIDEIVFRYHVGKIDKRSLIKP